MLAIALLRVYPKIGVGVYRTPQHFGKSANWHSDRFDRARKDLGNKLLQIDCCFE